MALPILAGAAVLGGLSVLYSAFKKDPNIDLAQFIKGRQLEEAMKAASHMQMEEKTRQEFAQVRRKRLEGLVETKQGLDEGWRSPAEFGIKGGGISAQDMPLVNMMAAQLGMDPQDLVARFDPTRSNFYTPTDRRGESITPPLKDVIRRKMEDAGPAQMNPMGGFGG
jgi:hypothetical protein